MRFFIVVLSCYILPYSLGINLKNQNLGDLHFHAKAGHLPLKYFPLTELDQRASEKVTDVVELIQLAPNVDPFRIPQLNPHGLDWHFLGIKGDVNATSIVLAGIKKIKVRGVEVRLDHLRIDLNLSFPLIQFDGDFDVESRQSNFLPLLSARTHFGLILKDLDISVSFGGLVTNAHPIGKVLQINSAELWVDIQNARFNLTNFHIGGAQRKVNKAVTQLLTSGGSQSGNMFDRLLKTGLKIINEKLLTIPFQYFRNFFVKD